MWDGERHRCRLCERAMVSPQVMVWACLVCDQALGWPMLLARAILYDQDAEISEDRRRFP